MHVTSPIPTDAAHIAERPGDDLTAFVRTIGAAAGLFDDGPDGGLGIVMSALAGIAAALAVAILLTVYFRSRDRVR
jgi:hypothetical protein